MIGSSLFATETNASPVSQTDTVREAYQKAKARYQAEPRGVEAAWEFGRACFDLGELARNKSERATLAEEGIAACKAAVEVNPNSAAAQYYLGMNYGQLARTKGIGALRIVGPMRAAFEQARQLDPKIDFGGPDRNLGMLYRDAPSWTVGDKGEAQRCLQRAVELAPDYPENRLELIEAYQKWGDRVSAREQFEALEGRWNKAREQLSGPKWEASWTEWQKRLQVFRAKLKK